MKQYNKEVKSVASLDLLIFQARVGFTFFLPVIFLLQICLKSSGLWTFNDWLLNCTTISSKMCKLHQKVSKRLLGIDECMQSGEYNNHTDPNARKLSLLDFGC